MPQTPLNNQKQMAKNIKCTEIQLTLHTIIVVVIGILIGASLVTTGDDIESDLSDKIYSVKNEYDKIDKSHDFLVNQFRHNYDKYRDLVYNGSEVYCKKIGNYAIDTSRAKELHVDMVETFSVPPKLFVSINGFDYQPGLTLADGQKEIIDFYTYDVTERSFKIKIQSSNREFNIEAFNRLDICYYAFTNADKNYDPLSKSL